MFDALISVDGEGNPSLPTSPYLDKVASVENVTLIDDYTLRVTYHESFCDNVAQLSLVWWPSHVFLSDPSFVYGNLKDHPFGDSPTVFSGPFMLDEWSRGDYVSLVRNPSYWRGAPSLDGILWKVVTDVTAEIEMMKAGEVDLIDLAPLTWPRWRKSNMSTSSSSPALLTPSSASRQVTQRTRSRASTATAP